MGRLKLFFIGVLVLNPLIYISAQAFNDVQGTSEQAYLDINAPILFSGQDLLYHITVQTSVKEPSKIAYLSLMDQMGKTWFLHKVAINKKGRGSGSFTVPTTAETGNYKLLSYTLWSKNNKKASYRSQDLLIINPFTPQKQTGKTPGTNGVYRLQNQGQPGNLNTSNSNISLNLKAEKHLPREEVKLGIKAETNQFEGDYVLSVRQIPQVFSDQKPASTVLDQKTGGKVYPPEIKGELISGSIQPEKDTGTVADQLVSLTIPGKNYLFKLTQTNAQGQFVFLLDQTYDTAESTIQVLEKSMDYTIKLDDNLPQPAKKSTFKEIILDPSLSEWINEQSVDLQIENAYKENTLKTKSDSLKGKIFYDPFATRYTLDDYTRFPSMHETFIEVITLAALRKDNDQTRVRVFNPDPLIKNELDKLDPLVLIDGIQVQDFSLVGNLNPARVDYIDVVAQQYRYGPKIFGGIIAISTKENDFKLPENNPNTKNFELLSPIQNSGFTSKNYQNPRDFDHIPDYRTQLYWDPELKITTQPQQVTFYTSDKEGMFEVLLTGYKTTGEKVEVRRTFSVSTDR